MLPFKSFTSTVCSPEKHTPVDEHAYWPASFWQLQLVPVPALAYVHWPVVNAAFWHSLFPCAAQSAALFIPLQPLPAFAAWQKASTFPTQAARIVITLKIFMLFFGFLRIIIK